MRSIIISIFILISLLIGTAGHSQTNLSSTNKKMNTKKQVFARLLFTALQKNDEALWLSLYPTDEEYKSLLQLMLVAKMDGLTQQKIDQMIGQRKKEASALYRKEFHELQAEAKKKGISLVNTTYQSFDSEAIYPTNFPKKYLNGDIWLAGKNGYYLIAGIEAVETENGYKLQAIGGIREVEESN
ncbi:MAG: hypothetical protein ABI402_05270 [Ferruginibacter sp.]